MRSNTWAGFSSCLNLRRNFTPWLSPLFELTKTNKGLVQEGGQVAFQKPVGAKGREREEKPRDMKLPMGMDGEKNQQPTPQPSYEAANIFLVLMALTGWMPNVHSPESSMNHTWCCQMSQLSHSSMRTFSASPTFPNCFCNIIIVNKFN